MTPEQRKKLKAAALAADQDGQHIYTNPRDSNNWRHNDAFNAAASPAVVLSLIAQVEALTVPPGWKLVPIEPTEAMVQAPATIIQAYGAKLIYQRMIEAAPTIPAIPGTKEAES